MVRCVGIYAQSPLELLGPKTFQDRLQCLLGGEPALAGFIKKVGYPFCSGTTTPLALIPIPSPTSGEGYWPKFREVKDSSCLSPSPVVGEGAGDEGIFTILTKLDSHLNK